MLQATWPSSRRISRSSTVPRNPRRGPSRAIGSKVATRSAAPRLTSMVAGAAGFGRSSCGISGARSVAIGGLYAGGVPAQVRPMPTANPLLMPLLAAERAASALGHLLLGALVAALVVAVLPLSPLS